MKQSITTNLPSLAADKYVLQNVRPDGVAVEYKRPDNTSATASLLQCSEVVESHECVESVDGSVSIRLHAVGGGRGCGVSGAR